MTSTYNSLQQAYDYFNLELFNGSLPDCLITMQRKKGSLGYFATQRFENKIDQTDIVHEIALNPAAFKTRTNIEVLSTLVHEMCHVWQQEQGTPSSKAYHNREWSIMMSSIGLIPSDTGLEGGKKTGQRMTHYIADLGIFREVATTFIEDNQPILYQDRAITIHRTRTGKTINNNKIKYTCTSCEDNAWGGSELSLKCNKCDSDFIKVG